MSNKKRIAALALCAALATTTLPFATACSSANTQSDGVCLVSYNLYDGAPAREMTVKSGEKARDWRAGRENHTFVGWYTDAACTVPYDFSQGVNKDITLYAAWNVDKGFVDVCFSFEGEAGKTNKTVALKAGETVIQKTVPDTERIGFDFTGWYKDEARTQKWDIENDVLPESDITLYAGYERNPLWVETDANGKVIYEEVSVNVWCASSSLVDYTTFVEVVDAFNAEYAGKIQVVPTKDFTGQATLLFRAQTNQGNMSDPNSHYADAELFSAAGVEFDNSLFYEDAIKDSFNLGIMKSIPFVSRVPYVIYNKALMQKYWGCIGNKLPANYTELKTLLSNAYEGEKAKKPDFVTLLQNEHYFQENTCLLPFIQNGLDFCKFENGKLINEWGADTEQAKVKEVLAQSYDLYGVNGNLHGKIAAGSNNQQLIDDVKNGKALFGIIGLSGGVSDSNALYKNYDNTILELEKQDTLGVMSASGLFTDNTDAASKRLPVWSVGISLNKHADGVTNKQICATVEFTKYLLEHSDKFADTGVAPLYKSAYEKFEQTKDKSERGDLIDRIVGDPANLYATPKATISKQSVALDTLLPFFKDKKPTDEYENIFTRLVNTIKTKI